MKHLTQEVAFAVLWLGMVLGPLVCLGAASFLAWKQAHQTNRARLLLAVLGILCGVAAMVTLWAAFLHEREYGFDFNNPSLRMKFVSLGSTLATFGMLGALFAKARLRTVLLIACLMMQMYWIFQVQAI